VAAERARKLLTYNIDGDLVSQESKDVDALYDAWISRVGKYTIRGSAVGRLLAVPTIIDAQTGRRIIATPWTKLIGAPLPGMAYSFLGIGIAALGGWLRRGTKGDAAHSVRPQGVRNGL
jgi:hypothetical protein